MILFVAFIIFEILLVFVSIIKTTINKNKKDNNLYEIMIEKLFQDISTFYDKLYPSDRKIINYFMENNNKEYITEGEIGYTSNSLLSSELVDSKVEYKQIKDIPSTVDVITGRASIKITKYKLKEEVYQKFKLVINKYGKLSKF